MKKIKIRNFVRSLLLELVIYSLLLMGYFFVVLRFLSDVLIRLFHTNAVIYAVLGLGLILAQGVALEALTSYLLRLLRLDRLR